MQLHPFVPQVVVPQVVVPQPLFEPLHLFFPHIPSVVKYFKFIAITITTRMWIVANNAINNPKLFAMISIARPVNDVAPDTGTAFCKRPDNPTFFSDKYRSSIIDSIIKNIALIFLKFTY